MNRRYNYGIVMASLLVLCACVYLVTDTQKNSDMPTPPESFMEHMEVMESQVEPMPEEEYVPMEPEFDEAPEMNEDEEDSDDAAPEKPWKRKCKRRSSY